jgi:hypothetical protein
MDENVRNVTNLIKVEGNVRWNLKKLPAQRTKILSLLNVPTFHPNDKEFISDGIRIFVINLMSCVCYSRWIPVFCSVCRQNCCNHYKKATVNYDNIGYLKIIKEGLNGNVHNSNGSSSILLAILPNFEQNWNLQTNSMFLNVTMHYMNYTLWLDARKTD